MPRDALEDVGMRDSQIFFSPYFPGAVVCACVCVYVNEYVRDDVNTFILTLMWDTGGRVNKQDGYGASGCGFSVMYILINVQEMSDVLHEFR